MAKYILAIDILNSANKLVPFEDNYTHKEGKSAAHIKSSLFNFSTELIIDEDELIIWRVTAYSSKHDGFRKESK